MDYITRKITSFLPSSSPERPTTKLDEQVVLDIDVSEYEETDIQAELLQQEQQQALRDDTSQHKPSTSPHRTRRDTPQSLQSSRKQPLPTSPPPSRPNPAPSTLISPPSEKARTPLRNTISSQWLTAPNRHARVLSAQGISPTAILSSLNEPAYACRATETRDALLRLTAQIAAFAEEFFSFPADATRLRPVLASLQPATVRIIGNVASGGPGGASGWEELFLDREKRVALVSAVVGNVLVEQVLGHVMFGGSGEQVGEVRGVEWEMRGEDGFDRTAAYATKIRSFLTPFPSSLSSQTTTATTPSSSLTLPPHFLTHTNYITAALLTHLTPFLSLAPPPHPPTPHPSSTPSSSALLIPALHALTSTAALLSLTMRLDAHTAYHFAPVHKETLFSRREMHCVNHAAMVATHPRGEGEGDGICSTELDRRAGLSAEERERMRGDQGVVQVGVFPGVVAFRRGGWGDEDGEEMGMRKRIGREGRGIRVRELLKARVYCRWGRQRVFVDGQPADEPEMHGVQWREGGFVEFFPGVEAVVDPRGVVEDVRQA